MSGHCPVPPVPPQRDTATYTPILSNVSLARRRVAWLTRRWGLPHLTDDAAVITSELCGNALLHGTLPDRYFTVELRLRNNVLRVAVTDPRGERLPAVREDIALPDGPASFGRGLIIVQALAHRWDVEPLVMGKTVWAELPVRP